MDYISALKAKALLAVLNPDTPAFLRHVFRWYSEKYSTPLHQVSKLPIEDILQHYYESIFEELKDDGDPRLQQHLDEIVLTPQEKAEIQDDDDAFLRAAQEEHDRQLKTEALKAVSLPIPTETIKQPPEMPEVSITFNDNLSIEEILDRDSAGNTQKPK